MKQFLLALLMVMFIATAAFAKVNINTADAVALESLKGIGPAKAADIISYRSEHGNFASVDDLTKVKGIGPKTLESIKADIELTQKTTSEKSSKSAKKDSKK